MLTKVQWITASVILWATVVTPCAAQPFIKQAHFADGSKNSVLLKEILRNLDNKTQFNRRFSISHVDCGTGCGSYWFVDDKTGAVIASPDTSGPNEMVWEMHSRPDSDVVEVVYGSQDGMEETCQRQLYRLEGDAFKVSAPKRSAPCPKH